MTRQHIPRRMSLPPPSAISFVSRVILAIIAVVLAGVAIASAPRSFGLSMGVALGGALVVSGILAAIARSRPARSQPARLRPAQATAEGGETDETSHPDAGVAGAPTRELAWLTLGLGSMAILAIGLVVPDDVGAALAAIAFTGLAIFRISVGWTFRVPREGPPDYPRGTSRRNPRTDSHAGSGPSGSSTRLVTA